MLKIFQILTLNLHFFPAVINALRNLQGKIHQLEVERTAAEDNLKCLATETNKYRNILHKDNERLQPTQTVVSKQNQGILFPNST